ncbi:MAG: hypothetical protein HQM10_15120 [Candidatus Riflebacteria bacterium]|nr:hypothetical protein [Candidatus Riflebacteria bacterium]
MIGRRLNLKVVSFVLGIILWIYVNLVLSPVVRRTVIVPVEYKNLPASFSLVKITPEKIEAEVILTGTRRDFILSGTERVQASLDLYNMRLGTAVFPVKTVVFPAGLSVISVRPHQIELKAEQLTKKTMDVEVEIKGQTSEGFVSEPPIVKPRQVDIIGLPDVVNKIVTCQASINLADVKNSVSEKRPVILFSTEGELNDEIKIDPDKVLVDVPVKAGYPSKAVSIAPNFINKLPEGLKLESFKIVPPMVTVSGPGRVLDEMNEIRASPIDLSLLSSSAASIAATVSSPRENLSIVGSSSVTFEFRLLPAPVTRIFREIPLSISCAPGQHSLVAPSSYSLVLLGKKASLETISPEDLKVHLEALNRPPGSYSVPLPCPKGLPDDVAIIEINPPEVEVIITPSIATHSD